MRFIHRKTHGIRYGICKRKENPFEVGYYSSVAIAILDEEKEMIEFHYIPIWKCEKIFLGMSIQSNILGVRK